MKTTSMAVVVCCVTFLLGGFTLSSVAQGGCSNTTIKGAYGFAGTGFIPEISQSTVRFDPVSHVATAIYDGQGKVSVKARVQYHGKVSPLDFNGSYDIHNDCTGTASFEDSNGKTVLAWNFVVVHGGDAVETIALRAPSPPRPMYSLTFSQKKL
jgi:hypothetical protein